MFKDRFEAKFENIGLCIERVEEYLLSVGVDSYVSSICMLALSEALNNVVEHSYADCSDGEIKLLVSVDEERILFQIEDRGNSSPENLYTLVGDMPDPFDLPEGGWGLAVIDSVMDNIDYCCKDGVNQLDLIKRIHPDVLQPSR